MIIIITGPIIIIIHIFSSKLDSNVKLINHSNLGSLFCAAPPPSPSSSPGPGSSARNGDAAAGHWQEVTSYNYRQPGTARLSGDSHTRSCTFLCAPKYLLYF